MAGGPNHKPSPHQEPRAHKPSPHQEPLGAGVGLSHKPSPHQWPPGAADGLWCGRLGTSATNRAHIRSPQEQVTDSGLDGWWPQPQTEPTSGAPRSRRWTLVWTSGGLGHKARPHQEPPLDGLRCGQLVASATIRGHIRHPQEQEMESGMDGWEPQPQTKPPSGAPRSRRRRTQVWMAGGLSHKPSPHQESLSHQPSPHQEPPGAGDGLRHKLSPHQEPPGAGDGLWCGRLGASATNRAHIRSPSATNRAHIRSPRSRRRPRPQTEPTSGAPRSRRQTPVWMAGGLSPKPSPHQEPPGAGDGLWCGRLMASVTNRAHIRSPQETDSGVDGWGPQPQTEPTSGAPQPQTEPTSGAPGAGDGLGHKLSPHQELPGAGDRLRCGWLGASATNQAHIRSPQEQETDSGVDG
ncbi:hypothetical protein NDU88_000152 [Pleurodeles waltl]|uniref:Uncharacterized protein n=1 Tax=Pleurodeles waltl TaxID=8319 RepID=A0AAV7P092_PLEWA|nr:hypothetical protein NDU88_000152 [Pleurodeles waltl]